MSIGRKAGSESFSEWRTRVALDPWPELQSPCFAVRFAGPGTDHILCHLAKGHDGPHANKLYEWPDRTKETPMSETLEEAVTSAIDNVRRVMYDERQGALEVGDPELYARALAAGLIAYMDWQRAHSTEDAPSA